MKKYLIIFMWIMASTAPVMMAQTKPADTVVIRVGEGSRITFTIRDKNDLETLKKYDVQALVNDLIAKLEQRDTSNSKDASDYLKKEDGSVESKQEEDTREENRSYSRSNEKWRLHRTHHSINFDLGTNNFLSNGSFPDQDNSLYTVRPWGSWYVGVQSIQRTILAKKFYLEWGMGVSWYNFKFQNERTTVSKDDSGVIFAVDPGDVDFRKSKLTATYLNASVVPMIDFGANRRKPSFFDSHNSDSFRIGAGGYIGYRINSYSKQVYEESNRRRSPKDHDNFYLNNLRYGVRVQVGFDDVDLFFNYDLNDLFSAGKGPQLNAFSFGVSF
jgi:hypothetical protein